ncbi:hypothetical protein [Secundilactobacillus odoratitofui]|uniref:hypothetical protein n=1 Tax=Secundilactobacillus odoratitofui TaxID=480930 RepID=UPI000AB0392C
MENKKSDLQAQMTQNGDNYDKLATLQSDFEATDQQLDEKNGSVGLPEPVCRLAIFNRRGLCQC